MSHFTAIELIQKTLDVYVSYNLAIKNNATIVGAINSDIICIRLEPPLSTVDDVV